MLNELSIENVAVIEKAEVRFGAGLNVLTGETGAGKSILIDSINAILGNRTSRELVRSGASKAAVWATFTQLPAEAQAALEAAGYDAEDELLLYREIGADGKTSCRVNGRPATAAILREIGASLLTIHGQHDNQSLLTPSKHLGILDGYAQHEALLQEYGQAYRALREVEKQITALSMDEGEKQRRLDLLRYQVEEIEAADLVEGEEEQLTEQRNKIRHSQKILDSLGAAYAALQGGEEFQGGVDLLGEAGGQVEGIGALSEEFSSLAEKLNDLYYSAQDLAAEIKDTLDGFDFDPSQLEEIEGRLDLLHGLKRKYGQSVGEVLSFYEKARAELDTIEFSDQKLAELTERRDRLYRGAAALADRLSRARKKAFEGFSAEIAACLQFLNMPGIRLALACQKVPLGPAGQDDLEFYISTNPGEAAQAAGKDRLGRRALPHHAGHQERDGGKRPYPHRDLRRDRYRRVRARRRAHRAEAEGDCRERASGDLHHPYRPDRGLRQKPSADRKSGGKPAHLYQCPRAGGRGAGAGAGAHHFRRPGD